VSAVGVVACLWLRSDVESPGRARSLPPEGSPELQPDGATEPAVRGAG
jgi:hypothetical protein